MTADMIREQVSQCFQSGGLDMEALGDFILDKTRTLVKLGTDLDADAVCHAFRLGEKIIVFLVVGRSVLAGREAYQWLLEYQNHNAPAANRNLEEIADYACEKLAEAGECTMPFRNPKSKVWRAFKVQPDGSLKSYNEIRKKVFMLNR